MKSYSAAIFSLNFSLLLGFVFFSGFRNFITIYTIVFFMFLILGSCWIYSIDQYSLHQILKVCRHYFIIFFSVTPFSDMPVTHSHCYFPKAHWSSLYCVFSILPFCLSFQVVPIILSSTSLVFSFTVVLLFFYITRCSFFSPWL